MDHLFEEDESFSWRRWSSRWEICKIHTCFGCSLIIQRCPISFWVCCWAVFENIAANIWKKTNRAGQNIKGFEAQLQQLETPQIRTICVFRRLENGIHHPRMQKRTPINKVSAIWRIFLGTHFLDPPLYLISDLSNTKKTWILRCEMAWKHHISMNMRLNTY